MTPPPFGMFPKIHGVRINHNLCNPKCLQSGLSGSWRGRFAGFSHRSGLRFYYQAPEVPFLGVRKRQLWKERGIFLFAYELGRQLLCQFSGPLCIWQCFLIIGILERISTVVSLPHVCLIGSIRKYTKCHIIWSLH